MAWQNCFSISTLICQHFVREVELPGSRMYIYVGIKYIYLGFDLMPLWVLIAKSLCSCFCLWCWSLKFTGQSFYQEGKIEVMWGKEE